MDRLKLYMRLVAVAALFILGAVGVFKGREILKGPKTAKKLEMGKKSKQGGTEKTEPGAEGSEDGTAGNEGAGNERSASGNSGEGSLYGNDPEAAGDEQADEESPEGEDADTAGSMYGQTGTPKKGHTNSSSAYGAVGDDTPAEDETDIGEESTEPKHNQGGSKYAYADDEEATDKDTADEPTAEESDVAVNEAEDETSDEEDSATATTTSGASTASDTNSMLARLRQQRLDGKSKGSLSDDADSTESETPKQSVKIAPSNVKIPEETEEPEEESAPTGTGLIGRTQSAANSLLGGATNPVRKKLEDRYANDPTTDPTTTDATITSAEDTTAQDTEEAEAPPTVAPEQEEEEEEAPTTVQPEREVAPEQEAEEPAPVVVPTERPRKSTSVSASSIPSAPIPATPIPSKQGGYVPQGAASNQSSNRNVPRPLPAYERDSSQPDRISSTSSSGRLAEGPQSPNVVLEKFAPPEVQVGQAATFELVVRNIGDAPAHSVKVEEEIPPGTEYQSASPEPVSRNGRKLVWDLGSLSPDDEKEIRLQLVPVSEGDIALSAQVHFQAQADARSVATRPVLEVAVESPQQIHAGEELPLRITVSNQGSGAATDVLIEEDVPSGFTHPRGKTLQYRVGTLGPGKSKTVVLKLKAEEAGRHRNALAVSAAGGILRKEETNIDVVAPSLKLGVSGPKRKYLDAQAVHVLTLENPGTAPAHNVEVVAHLPRGLKFVTATNHGAYDASRHAVYWDLEQLPPGSQGAVRVTTLVEETGAHRIEAEARAAEGVHAQAEYSVKADASSELPFTVSDLSDPIEIGEETVYEVRLANRGAQDATGVIVQATFPKEIRPLAVEGDVPGTVSGGKVTFSKIERIGVGQSLVLKVAAKALQPGDFRVAVSVASDDSKTPVVHEEATRVYRDE